jgi:hypothetical protein
MEPMKLFAFFPLIFRVVMSIEEVLGSLPGATKKTIALTLIDKATDAAEASGMPPVASVGKAIDAIVEALNVTGVFKKASAPAQ